MNNIAKIYNEIWVDILVAYDFAQYTTTYRFLCPNYFLKANVCFGCKHFFEIFRESAMAVCPLVYEHSTNTPLWAIVIHQYNWLWNSLIALYPVDTI